MCLSSPQANQAADKLAIITGVYKEALEVS